MNYFILGGIFILATLMLSSKSTEEEDKAACKASFDKLPPDKQAEVRTKVLKFLQTMNPTELKELANNLRKDYPEIAHCLDISTEPK